MGILSSSVSITRYRVNGTLEGSILETVAKGLKQHCIDDIDGESSDKAIGWTSFSSPFQPDFEGSSFVVGNLFVFSLRIDKKSIPPKIVQKHFQLEMANKLKESGRDFLSKNEKKMIKEHVINVLNLRIPSTPNIYDIIWNYEESSLWFFSHLKSANEELETLFTKAFRMALIRLFPYTMGELTCDLTPHEAEILNKLSPTNFSE